MVYTPLHGLYATAWFNWIVLNTIVLEQATYVIFSIELSVRTRCSQITRFLRA
jgi:hypothetical protein